MHKSASGSTWEKLIDIKSFPDLGGSPETLDTTTLTDKMKTSILGIQDMGSLEFDANYDLADFRKLKAMEGKQEDYAVWLGGTESVAGTITPNGENGKFSFKGALSVFVKGGSVNEVVGMTVTIASSTVINLETE